MTARELARYRLVPVAAEKVREARLAVEVTWRAPARAVPTDRYVEVAFWNKALVREARVAVRFVLVTVPREALVAVKVVTKLLVEVTWPRVAAAAPRLVT